MARSDCVQMIQPMMEKLVPYELVQDGHYMDDGFCVHGTEISEWRTYKILGAPMREAVTLYLAGNRKDWPCEEMLQHILRQETYKCNKGNRQYYLMWIKEWNCRCHNCNENYGTNGVAIHVCRRERWFNYEG